MKRRLLTLVLLVTGLCWGQSHTMVSVEDAQTVTGAKTFAVINGVQFVYGSDWVAGINAADTAIGNNPGTIYVTTLAAGTSATALSLQTSASRQIIFLPGIFITSNGPLVIPANVSLVGLFGRASTTIKCTAAAECLQLESNRGSYVVSGGVRNLTIDGNSAATVGVHIQNRQELTVDNVLIDHFAQQGFFADAVLTLKFKDSIVQNSGDATHAQVDITGQQNNASNSSTTVALDNIRINSGNAAAIAGLDVDRCSNCSAVHLVSQTTGCPVRIGSKSENTTPVNEFTLDGADLENPNGGTSCDHYIEIGQGWNGSASLAARNTILRSITGSVSGSTSVKFGIKFYNTSGSKVENSSFGLSNLAGSPVTYYYWYDGTGNIHRKIKPGSTANLTSGQVEYAATNSATDRSINPSLEYNSDGINVSLAKGTPFATTVPDGTTAIDISGTSLVVTANSGATSVSDFNLNGSAPVGSPLLFVLVTDTHTTLKNNNGGVGPICNVSGADIAATQNHIYEYLWDGGCWRQIGGTT